jgi:hypothetical protein
MFICLSIYLWQGPLQEWPRTTVIVHHYSMHSSLANQNERLRDPESSHDCAYLRIFAACASFENLPRFFSSDSLVMLQTRCARLGHSWNIDELEVRGRFHGGRPNPCPSTSNPGMCSSRNRDQLALRSISSAGLLGAGRSGSASWYLTIPRGPKDRVLASNSVRSLCGRSPRAYPESSPSSVAKRVERDGTNDSQFFQGQSIRYLFGMRYQANTRRVWFARKDQAAVGMVPLADAPIPKDRWISPDAEVVTYPPVLN